MLALLSYTSIGQLQDMDTCLHINVEKMKNVYSGRSVCIVSRIKNLFDRDGNV